MKVSVAFITLILFPYSLSLPSCDKVCPENQVYSSKVSQCQNTCWNRKFNETSKCQTLPGCKCKFGYLRHPDSYECIPESTCPQKTNQVQCGKNEFYSICKNSLRECEKTCDTKNGDLKNCSCKNGCTCKDGYVRSSVTFQCIPKSDCTKCPTGYTFDTSLNRCRINCVDSTNIYCPKNEKFDECGSKCRELKCSQSGNKNPIVCAPECLPGCYCDHSKGYRRDLVTNKCVLSNNCTQCPENERIMCGNPLCERTCATIDEKCTKFPIRCEYKCYCEENYVRAFQDSQCVSVNQCPVINTRDQS